MVVVAAVFPQVVLCFDPPDVGHYKQVIRVQTSVNEYTVVCTGEGVRPKLSIEPAAPTLHVGDAVVDTIVTQVVKLRNETDRPLSYNVIMSQKKRANKKGKEPFGCVPATGVIPPSSVAEVEVRFCPDHQSTGFGCLMTVDVPSEIETHEVVLSGRGWESAMFVVGGEAAEEEARSDKLSALPDLFVGLGAAECKQLLLPLSFSTPLPEGFAAPGDSSGGKGGKDKGKDKGKKGKGSSEPDEEMPEPPPLAVGVLECGNAGTLADKASGEITLENLSPEAIAQGFALEPAGGYKGIGPGELKSLVFTYTPVQPEPGTAPALLQGLGAGQVYETTLQVRLFCLFFVFHHASVLASHFPQCGDFDHA